MAIPAQFPAIDPESFQWKLFSRIFPDQYHLPALYRYVVNSDYAKALEYLNKNPQDLSCEAFVFVAGRNVFDHLFDQDPDVQKLVFPLLDAIVAQRKKAFSLLRPFSSTLKGENYKHFIHLVKAHGKCLTDKVIKELLCELTQVERPDEVSNALVDHLRQKGKLPFILSREENSFYFAAATRNFKIFKIFTQAVGMTLTDEYIKLFLVAIAQGKIPENASNYFMEYLRQVHKTNLIGDGGDNSPLAEAVRSDNEKIFQLFLPAIDCLSFRLAGDRTLIHEMAKSKSMRCLKVMWKEKTQETITLLDKRDERGRTAIFEAASRNRFRVVDLLISFGADFTIACGGKTPYEVSPFQSQSSMLIRSAEWGFFSVDPEFERANPELVRKRRERGLLTLCSEGNALKAKELVAAHKVDPNIVDQDGNTPLLLLLKSQNSNENEVSDDPEFERANPELVRVRRERRLLALCSEGNARKAKELVETHKVDPNIVDQDGNTPLFLLLKSQNSNENEVSEFLSSVRKLIDMDYSNKFKETALVLAYNREDFFDISDYNYYYE